MAAFIDNGQPYTASAQGGSCKIKIAYLRQHINNLTQIRTMFYYLNELDKQQEILENNVSLKNVQAAKKMQNSRFAQATLKIQHNSEATAYYHLSELILEEVHRTLLVCCLLTGELAISSVSTELGQHKSQAHDLSLQFRLSSSLDTNS